jgi:hypothetical protein
VHILEEVVRVDLEILHEPGKRRPVRVEMILLHAMSFLRVAVEEALDVGRHPLVD